MSSIPSLTTRWIPVGGDSREHAAYWGTYEAARIYNDGDCVLGVDGILYMCTKNGTITAPSVWPTKRGPQGEQGPQGPQGPGMPAPVANGQWLKGVDGAAVWTSLNFSDIPNLAAKPSYGTSMPGNPVDGQEHILVDNVATPAWSWYCRYNASCADAYKWDVFGNSLSATLTGQLTVNTAGAWVSITSNSIKIPRSGLYMCQASCRMLNNGGAGAYNHLIMASNGNIFGPTPVYSSGTGLWGSAMISPFAYQLVGGENISLYGWISAVPGYYDQWSWSIKPVRIS